MADAGTHVQATPSRRPAARSRSRYRSMNEVVVGFSVRRRATSGQVSTSHANHRHTMPARANRAWRIHRRQRRHGLTLASCGASAGASDAGSS